MKKYYQFFGLVLIMVFSFYYTEQIATIVLNKNPLMQMIKEEARNYNVSSVNALIDGNYIVPGLKGLEVNLRDSFYNMKESNVFSEYFLVFDEVKPEISLNVSWQREFLNDMKKIVEINGFSILVATHSPQIINDNWDMVETLGELE